MTPKKILIVDNQAYVRLLVEQSLQDLEDEGVELLMAEDGEEALEVVRSKKPDLMILDIMMPKIDGFEVCDRVKHQMGMGDVFVIILTARGMDVDHQRGREVGADEYMTKPFDPVTLLDTARQVLGL
ncbi:MAG: response regulator [Anaerolineales bacterium]|nr:response regulator [Anaerolineales bacterium]